MPLSYSSWPVMLPTNLVIHPCVEGGKLQDAFVYRQKQRARPVQFKVHTQSKFRLQQFRPQCCRLQNLVLVFIVRVLTINIFL